MTVNQYLEKGRQVYVEGEVNGEAVNGSQNPRVWIGSDGVAKADYEITARTLRFLSHGAPVAVAIGEPLEWFEDDSFPSWGNRFHSSARRSHDRLSFTGRC